jgi:hypothetical protein
VRKTRDNQRLNQKTAPRLDEEPPFVQVTVGAEEFFSEVLLGVIDEAFSSLGKSIPRQYSLIWKIGGIKDGTN